MSTATQNWYPNLPDPAPTSGLSYGELTSGAGAPDDANGNNGDVYVDTTAGTLYKKSSDVWSALTGGVGASNIFGYDGNPNGHVSATGEAIVLGKVATLGAVWVKVSAGTSNSEWTQVIAP